MAENSKIKEDLSEIHRGGRNTRFRNYMKYIFRNVTLIPEFDYPMEGRYNSNRDKNACSLSHVLEQKI